MIKRRSNPTTMNPDMTQLKKVGSVTVCKKDHLDIYWNPLRRTTIICDEQDFYETCEDNITASLAKFMMCESYQLCADQVMVFDYAGNYLKAGEDLKLDIYDCDWSDFACENQIIAFNVRKFNWMRDRFERDATTFMYDTCLPDSDIDYDSIYRIAEALRWGDEADTTYVYVSDEDGKIAAGVSV